MVVWVRGGRADETYLGVKLVSNKVDGLCGKKVLTDLGCWQSPQQRRGVTVDHNWENSGCHRILLGSARGCSVCLRYSKDRWLDYCSILGASIGSRALGRR